MGCKNGSWQLSAVPREYKKQNKKKRGGQNKIKRLLII